MHDTYQDMHENGLINEGTLVKLLNDLKILYEEAISNASIHQTSALWHRQRPCTATPRSLRRRTLLSMMMRRTRRMTRSPMSRMRHSLLPRLEKPPTH